MSTFMRENEKLGLRIYTQTQNNKAMKVIADILSFTSDEVIWFGLPGIVGCTIFSIRMLMGTYTMGCFEEAVWDCFGSSMVGTFFESIMKLIFRTTRPYYAKQSTFHSILGEVYSFPSGHTLRAFYWMFWLTRNRFVRLFIHLPRARYFLPWALGVGWSRVAKGKHWPIDVFAGAIVGSILGYIVEDYFSVHARGVMKTVAGIYTATGWGFLALIPFFGGPTKQGRIIAGIVYFAFSLSVLYNTFSLTQENSGNQTIESVIIGDRVHSSQCNSHWLW